jgi:hypothetical protein
MNTTMVMATVDGATALRTFDLDSELDEMINCLKSAFTDLPLDTWRAIYILPGVSIEFDGDDANVTTQ